MLYVNQTARISGAERSLVDLLDALPTDVSPFVAAPPGELFDDLSGRGVPTEPIAATDMSFRMHPVHTSRGLAWVIRVAAEIRRLARSLEIDVIHANSTRAGLAAGLATRASDTPLVVHVRDWVPEGRAGRATLGAIGRTADVVIANSAYVADQIPPVSGRREIRVVHNGIDLTRFDPDLVDREAARRRLGLAPDDEVLAIVAQFAPWKGQDDAVRVLSELATRRPRLRLLVAGTAKFTASGTRFDNAGFERDVHELARSLGVADRVSFLGDRDDVPEILRAADVLLVPSWKEAFGRIVIEGMAMRLPVIATAVGGPAEVIRDGIDGLLMAPRGPAEWAVRVDELLARPDRREEIGIAARDRVESHFTVARHVEQVVDVYKGLVGTRASS